MTSDDLLFWPQHDHGAAHLFWDPAGDDVRFWAGVHFETTGGLLFGGHGAWRFSYDSGPSEISLVGIGGLVIGGHGSVRFAPAIFFPGWGAGAPYFIPRPGELHVVAEGGLVIGGRGSYRFQPAQPPPKPRSHRHAQGEARLVLAGTGTWRSLDYVAEVLVPEDELLVLI